MAVCGTCGANNPDGVRFCGACATPLGSPGGGPREERRVVTVLFADLAGFTTRAETLDPEDVRAFLHPYYELLEHEVAGYGGVIERHLGDGVMALFGAPIAHEDDPERAVRAALAILTRLPSLGLDLHARLGINTGAVLFAAGGPGREDAVTGDAVNTAARLQAAAPVDGIVVGEATYRTTARAFRYEALEPVVVKGKREPIPLWRPIAPIARPAGALHPETTPFVGRDFELAALVHLFERSRSTASLEVVTIVADPGIGKSRLVRELARHVDALPDLVTWRVGRCLPYGDGISFWALGEIVKAHAGILDTDDQVTLSAKLDAVLVEPDRNLRAWIKDRVGPLVGLETTSEPPQKEEAFTAWRRFLESIAAAGPTVLIVEDLHWADDVLVQFLGHLAANTAGLPLLVVTTARPEIEERHPAWLGRARRSTVLSLDVLRDTDMTALVEATLPGASPELLATVVSRAAGSPLYAEQLAAMFRDRPLPVAGGSLDETAIPPTIAALLASRIDALPRDAKAVLLDASVVGKTFWSRAVAALGDRSRSAIEPLLAELTHRELIRPVFPSSMAGEAEYTFVHALVRDVAYGELTRSARLARHKAAAAWITGRAGAALGADAEIVVAHLERALELAEATRATAELPGVQGSLIDALLVTGNNAMRTGAGSPRAPLDRACELMGPDDPRRPETYARLGQALSLSDLHAAVDAFDRAASAYRDSGDFDAIGRFIVPYHVVLGSLGEDDRAEAMLRELQGRLEGQPGPGLVAVLGERAFAQSVSGNPATGMALAERALGLASDLGRHPPPRVLDALGGCKTRLGDPSGEADMRSAAERFLEEGDPERAVESLMGLSVFSYRSAGFAAALPIIDEAVFLAESRGHWGGAPVVRLQFLTALGRWDEVLAQLPAVLEGASQRGDITIVAELVRLRLILLLERGDALALELTRDDPLLERLYEFDDPREKVRCASLRLELQMARGEPPTLDEMELIASARTTIYSPRAFAIRSVVRAGAPDLASRLLALYAPEESFLYGAECRASAGVVAEALGETARARDAYAEALSTFLGGGDVWEAAYALAGLGRCLLALGETEEGVARLRDSREIWERLRATPRIAEIDAALAAAGALSAPGTELA